MDATLSTSALKAATSYTSNSLSDPVKLRLAKEGFAAIKPQSVPHFFHECCQKYAHLPAFVYRANDINNNNVTASANATWTTLTFSELKDKVQQTALLLLHVGLEPHTSVGILAANCPQWVYAQFGTMCAGGVVAGIYPTNSAEAVYHVLHTSDATVCIVDDAQQMAKVRAVKSRLPRLRAVLQLNGPYDECVGSEDGYYRWGDLENMKFGIELQQELKRRERNVYANECAILVFTSGSVGMPKGVMLSHDSLLFGIKLLYKTLSMLNDASETIVTYLPACHIASQIFEINMCLYKGACMYFADCDVLKGTLKKTLREARPTYLFGVPRIFEKIQEQFNADFEKMSALQQYIINTAKNIVEEYQMSSESNGKISIKYWLAAKIMKGISASYGLERCKVAIVGSSLIMPETKRFILGLNIPIYECYGMSESSCTTVMATDCCHLETIGKPMETVGFKIDKPDHRGYGEICMSGRLIFMGYVKEQAKTRETLSEDGWLRTGDVGYLDKNGNLMIPGRIKEIIVTSGGENIPFLRIESLIKEHMDFISNAMLIGDGRKYLTVLLTLKTEMDTQTGLPLDTLSSETIKWLKSLNLSYTKLSEALHIPSFSKDMDSAAIIPQPEQKILTSIQAGLAHVNANAISNAQRVQKFTLLPHDFSLPTGELGPTMKIRRVIIVQKYAKFIESMYQ